MARLDEQGIPLSSMSPSFLHSNSTSHTTPFSAVAELIDNAADPGVSAQTIRIDVINEAGNLCLTFTDDGLGMTPSKLHKMLSFGFTDKGSGKASQQAIGIYGNGFKSGSMRLGRDALIFTKNGGCQTVGLLSQTYLENIKAQAVMVPIAPFSQHTKSLIVTKDSIASLAAILQHSIVTSEKQIHTHFDSIGSKKGTKILIWNIRRDNDGKPEIDFVTDNSDFTLPEIHIKELKKDKSLRTGENKPDICHSLKAYLHILHLKPVIEIILRGEKIPVKQPSLTHVKHELYNPHFSKEKARVIFGINQTKQPYGIMMYHKNRLIKAYEKVGWQLMTSGKKGIGVIGIVECNFLKPAHNKQDFVYTNEYRRTIATLGQKLNDYWKNVEKVVKEKPQEQVFLNESKDKIQHNAHQEQPESRKEKKSLEESSKKSAEPVLHLHRLKSVGITVDKSKPVEETSVVDQDMDVKLVDPVDHTERRTNTNAKIQTCDQGQISVRNDTNVQRQMKHVDIPRNKRKSDSVCGVMAKRFTMEIFHGKGDAFDQKKQRNTFNTVNSESPKAISKCSTVQSSEGSEQTSLLSTLPVTGSQSEGPQSQQRLSENDQEAKLPTVEREVQRSPTLQGRIKESVSAAHSSTGNQREILVIRDDGCQTTVTKRFSVAAESVVEKTRDMSGSKELPELNGLQKNQQKVCDCGENSRSVHEKLVKLRDNVVLLLTTVLPRLDLTGICLETSDVDNILQQIIEVNSLKM
ncbi:MORC family CW-type zinc finger protein 4 isoform X2 [Gouania willdenowi]|uniref:MORC family CW-type zinc finger protein 4 isoform X2 n=1 Tax=Gouania willdenowi TaxID=441366 RepID=UPI0010561834|nr:MORC family CW-type zinc finger protein 4-like isoform X2 [Gouania willdenowi]